MVDSLDIGLESFAQEGTHEGKEPLEKAKGNGHEQAPTGRHLALERTGGGNHQAVDTKRQRDKERFNQSHYRVT
jgi:hypothetical protein